MAANQSTPDFDDELLSAYVDNELTPAERAAVEERLRTDERARQTLAELQRAADALKALPARRLGRDLSANIWAAIDAAKADEPAVLLLPPRDGRRDSGYGRGLVWTALAIAAALLLMVLRPGAELGDQTSVAKQGSVAKNKAESDAKAPKDAKEDARDLTREESVGVDAPAASAARQETANAEPRSAVEPLAEIGAETQTEAARSRDNVAANGVVTDGIVANGNLADGELATSRLEDKQAPAPGVARGVAASAAPAGAGPSKLAMEAQSEGAEAIVADAASREQLRTIEVSVASADGVATFERMLARHQIAMVNATDEFAPLAAATSGAAVEAKATAATESEGAQSGQAGEGGEAEGGTAQGDASPGNLVQGDGVQSAAPVAILVEASPEAIAAILATLQPQAESRYAFRKSAEKSTEFDALAAGAAVDGAATREAGAANSRAWRVPIDAYYDESGSLPKIAAAEAAAPPATTAAPAGARGGRGGGGGGLGGGGRGGFGGGRGGFDGRALEGREPLERVMFIVRPE